jgi:hypothetical protein
MFKDAEIAVVAAVTTRDLKHWRERGFLPRRKGDLEDVYAAFAVRVLQRVGLRLDVAAYAASRIMPLLNDRKPKGKIAIALQDNDPASIVIDLDQLARQIGVRVAEAQQRGPRDVG